MKINKNYGVLVSETPEHPIQVNNPVRMPCGWIVVPPESGWPTKEGDLPCPCGDPTHILFSRQIHDLRKA